MQTIGRCTICKCELVSHVDGDPNSLQLDCGGDCLLCMAEAGDTDCLKSVLEIKGINIAGLSDIELEKEFRNLNLR